MSRKRPRRYGVWLGATLLPSLLLELWALELLLSASLRWSMLVHLAACVYLPSALVQARAGRDFGTWLLWFIACVTTPIVSCICLPLVFFHDDIDSSQVSDDQAIVTTSLRIPDDVAVQFRGSQSPARPLTDELGQVDDASARRKAVLATRPLPNEAAVPILRIGLRDRSDEVRLLAFCMLERRRKALEALLHDGLGTLESGTIATEHLHRTHSTLAEVQWELSYLGFVRGHALRQALTAATHHVAQALRLNGDVASLHLLQARILLKLDRPGDAATALRHARELVLPAAQLAPYWAEVAYQEKQFGKIREYLHQIDDLGRMNGALGGIVRQWT